jgi:putative PIN family toxin of toxin-antitoxin system
MRVVLDTNIFVSGIHWDGLPRKVLQKRLDYEIINIASIEIVEEVIRILNDFKIPLTKQDLELWKI